MAGGKSSETCLEYARLVCCAGTARCVEFISTVLKEMTEWYIVYTMMGSLWL